MVLLFNVGVVDTLSIVKFPVTEAEYVDAFVGADEENYCELLLLAGSDYNMVIFMPLVLLEQYPQFNAINE